MQQKMVMLNNPTNSQLELICFPYGGGAPHEFAPWRDKMPPGVGLRVAQYAGTGARMGEALCQNVQALVHDFLPLFSNISGKFVLFGHSMGALTVFELARALEKAGRGPEHLFVSGLIAPHLPKSYATVHTHSDSEFDKILLEFGGLPEDLMSSPDFMSLVRPILRAAFQVWETYSFKEGPKLNCPVTAFGGSRDFHYPGESVRQWECHTNGLFDFHLLEGDHFFLHQSREVLLNHIRRVLQKVSGI